MNDQPARPAQPASPGRGRNARPPRAPRVRRQRSVQESLGSIVLGFELIIVGLAALVVFGLHKLPPLVALGGGAVLCVLLLAVIPLLRYRAGFVIGWVLQAFIFVVGFFIPEVFFVSVPFGAMWAFCMIRGARIDRDNRALAAAQAAVADDPDIPSSPTH
ncbi:DUF4233 domain-containing protein [Subtercola sp. YIM 133946]|uniref:DUF4233 domain-containing protein n=1 Tax=Subtercola sp. YIM 133946 TaxID=3118909 RepID=UPI002F938896